MIARDIFRVHDVNLAWEMAEASEARSNRYAIRNINDAGLAWSNEWGWVDNESYDLFTEREKATLNLPVEGQWWKVS